MNKDVMDFQVKSLFSFFDHFSEPSSWQALLSEPYEELYRSLDHVGFVESPGLKSLHLSWLLAEYLLDENGSIDRDLLIKSQAILAQKNEILKGGLESEGIYIAQVSRVLYWLSEDKILGDFESLDAMRSDVFFEFINGGPYRQYEKSLSSVEYKRAIKVAVLSAWMNPLRQSVGSCFASAPAIVVQSYQPSWFLQDMHQLLSRGALTRVVEGNEFVVPLSDSLSVGNWNKKVYASSSALKDPSITYVLEKMGLSSFIETKSSFVTPKELIHLAQKKEGKDSEQALDQACRLFSLLSEHSLLKSWEFTLASFSETRHEFCRWNMYISLGMNKDQEGGIASRLYDVVNESLERANQRTREVEENCNQLQSRVNYAVNRLNLSKNESEKSWLLSDYQSVKAEYDQSMLEHQTLHQRAQGLANLYGWMLNQYDKLFPGYFQEVYDPNLQAVHEGLYEDSPAGFRLVFKFGRHISAGWESISNQDEYIEALARFFISSETVLAQSDEIKGLEKELSSAITSLIQHVRGDTFIKSAFERLLLQRNSSSVSTPWSYVSGGNMGVLLSYYYGRSQKPIVEKVFPHSPLELWASLIDQARIFSSSSSKEKKLNFPLLMHSTDHAFIFHPALEPFKASWDQDVYPYTWIRDYYVEPQREIYGQKISFQSQCLILKHLFQHAAFSAFSEDLTFVNNLSHGLPDRLLVQNFYKVIDERFRASDYQNFWLSSGRELFQGCLWSCLPCLDRLTIIEKAKDLVKEQVGLIDLSSFENELKSILESLSYSDTVLACEFWSALVEALGRVLGRVVSSGLDLWKLQMSLHKYKLGSYAPVVFADSNWRRFYFAFVLSPVTDELEIWRVEPKTFYGYPMRAWNQMENNNENSFWGVYKHPLDYKIL